MVQIFRLIARETAGQERFGLDEMIRIATSHGQASARGAHGALAVERSRDKNRSLDPLFNQLKMYSEVYRMLGWLRPMPDKRLEFRVTLLGETLAFDAADDPGYTRGLLAESLLSIVFPNTATNNVGVVAQRPFRWLLLLMDQLDGVITRHEMILGLLAVVDDREENSLEAAAARIGALRGRAQSGLSKALADFAAEQKVQVNTLSNYTRLPVGVLKAPLLGWGEATNAPLYVGRPVRALRLTPPGAELAREVAQRTDVRESSLSKLSASERAAFASYGFYALLDRAGAARVAIAPPLAEAAHAAAPALQALQLTTGAPMLYNPFVQEPDAILRLAEQAEAAS